MVALVIKKQFNLTGLINFEIIIGSVHMCMKWAFVHGVVAASLILEEEMLHKKISGRLLN